MFDFKCRMYNTIVELIAGDISQIQADVLVSADDIYLSMSGGVAQALSDVAGPRLKDDVRKFSLPLDFGSMIVTGAGNLSARYVFHAVSRDFIQNVDIDIILPNLVKRLLDTAAVLSVDHLALPLIGAGSTGLSEEEVVEYIFKSVMYHLASGNYTINQLTIVLYEEEKDLRQHAERLFKMAITTTELQERIKKMEALRDEVVSDTELFHLLDARLSAARDELKKLFHISAMDTSGTLGHTLSAEASEKAREKLEITIDGLEEEEENLKTLRETDQKRLDALQERKEAATNQLTAEEEMELSALNRQLEQRAIQLLALESRKRNYRRELSFLRTSHRTEIFEILNNRFDINELQTLCFLLDIDYEGLSGLNKVSKIRSLINFVERRRVVDELIKTGVKIRDDIDWPTLSS
ncbi:MAG: macro domain-containing protein [Anaerolineales bacterium]|nr:macro domain-containing protein [Anaerolineales bacterium]